MFFDKILNPHPTGGGTISGGGLDNARATVSDALQINNVWSGPIIILSSDQQAELDRHYLSYNSTISSESFDAIFGDRSGGDI